MQNCTAFPRTPFDVSLSCTYHLVSRWGLSYLLHITSGLSLANTGEYCVFYLAHIGDFAKRYTTIYLLIYLFNLYLSSKAHNIIHTNMKM